MNPERNHHARHNHDPHQEALFEMEIPYEYKQLDSPELRYQYVGFTEDMIAKAVEQGTDSMIFLDKSARPVAWLMKELWPTLGINDDGEAVPMPDIKFANIDREQWATVLGRSEDKSGGMINVDAMPKEALANLRRTFAKGEHAKREDVVDGQGRLRQDLPDVEAGETLLSGKNVMVIDEVAVSGDTLSMASKLIDKAFPDANNVVAHHWMIPEIVTNRAGARYNKDLPIWYNSHKVTGRLVANRAEGVSGGSKSTRQRIGALFLSTRFPFIDEDGIQLKKEMKALGAEVRSGQMPVKLSAKHRDLEQFDSLMERVNGVSVDEYVKLRKQAEKESKPFAHLFAEYKRARAAADQNG